MCAPIPLGAHLRLNGLHNNLHSRVFSAHRALAIGSRQATPFLPIPQGAPQNINSQVEASVTLPVITPPSTVLSPSESVSIPGLSSQEIQTVSIAPSVSTIQVTSSTHVQSSSWSVVTLTSSFTSNLAPPNTIVSGVPSSTRSAVVSSTTAPIWKVSSMYDTTSNTVSTTTITPVISQSDSTVTTTSYSSIQSTETDNFLTESFTPAPSSTLSAIIDPSSSVITSSTTTNDTAPAVDTVVSSPIPVRPASLSAHNPSFYVGIVLGTVAAIACLCALIAWFIRLRIHARRRQAAKSLKIPWANSDDSDSWRLESGHGPGSDADLAAVSAMNLGSREDLAHVQAWSPRGDRDVGEPRRTESYMNGSTYSLQNHPIPEYCLFSDDSVRAFESSEGYSTASLLPHHNLRQLPSHLIDQELAARVSREHASLRSNNNLDINRMDFPINRACGTPRETMNKPRFLSLRGEGLNVPWHLGSERSPRSMVERLRNHGKPLPAEPPWEQISPLQSSGEINKSVGAEPWSSSFRSSLVSAFNAVAANLSSAAGAPRMNDGEFTPIPPKRTARKSVRDTFWDEDVVKVKELDRKTSVSTATSQAWILEETREGAGVVRLFISGLQGRDAEAGIQRPHLSGPILSFGDGDDIISHDDGTKQRIVEHLQVPLIASEKPPPAVMRPDRRNTRSRGGPTASSRIRSHTKCYDDSSDSIVIEPSQISRLSSSDSSTTSTILNGVTGECMNTAFRALQDRRNRVLD